MEKALLSFFTILASLLISLPSLFSANVAVFYNSSYVATENSPTGEAYVLTETLASQGHTVNTFTGFDAAAFSAAIAANDVLVIPELESGDLSQDISPAAITVLQNYVNGGGVLLTFGTSPSNSGENVNFLNAVFGFSLTKIDETATGNSALNAADAAGTIFDGGPGTITNNLYTSYITNLPIGGKSIYETNGGTSVALLNYGAGNIVYYGWCWFNAVPVGPVDGGWLGLLDNAVNNLNVVIPTMSQWAYFLFSLTLFSVFVVGLYNVKQRGVLKV